MGMGTLQLLSIAEFFNYPVSHTALPIFDRWLLLLLLLLTRDMIAVRVRLMNTPAMIVHTLKLIAHTLFVIVHTPYKKIQAAGRDLVIAQYLKGS